MCLSFESFFALFFGEVRIPNIFLCGVFGTEYIHCSAYEFFARVVNVADGATVAKFQSRGTNMAATRRLAKVRNILLFLPV